MRSLGNGATGGPEGTIWQYYCELDSCKFNASTEKRQSCEDCDKFVYTTEKKKRETRYATQKR